MKIVARIGGSKARVNGQCFERLIDQACRFYAEAGAAKIEKTPEPMKPLRPPNRMGQFLACYTKQAQPDYKGTLRGGRAVIFEAKHTDATRIEQNRVTEEQLAALLEHEKLGAACFILVSFGFKNFYRVPVEHWQQMKRIYDKVSVNEKDLAPFLLKRLNFLGKTADGKSII